MNTLLLIILFIPLVEIYLFIQIGGQIGAFNTILVILLTAVVGVYFARLQGLNTLKSGITQLYRNQIPIYEMMSGAALAFAALLLIIPGFLTDFIGFLFLIPFTRRMLAGVETSIELDLPFHLAERKERIAFAKAALDNPTVSPAEGLRQVLEAFNVEAEYGLSLIHI